MAEKKKRLNWEAIGVLLSAMVLMLAGFRTVLANSMQIKSLGRQVIQADQNLEKNLDELKSDVRDMRRLLDDILKEMRRP